MIEIAIAIAIGIPIGTTITDDAPALRCRQNRLHAAAERDASVMRRDPARGRIRKERTQIDARQQEIRSATDPEHRIAQHAQEHLAAGGVGSGVQRRDAQWIDHLGPYTRREFGAEVGHCARGLALELRALPSCGHAQQRELVAP